MSFTGHYLLFLACRSSLLSLLYLSLTSQHLSLAKHYFVSFQTVFILRLFQVIVCLNRLRLMMQQHFQALSVPCLGRFYQKMYVRRAKKCFVYEHGRVFLVCAKQLDELGKE